MCYKYFTLRFWGGKNGALDKTYLSFLPQTAKFSAFVAPWRE